MIQDHFRYLTTPKGYPGIDLLRAIAVAIVVPFHFHMFPVGWIGVDLFFVISGFLIGGLILRDLEREKFSFRTFYWHRALRIFPVYYAAMLVTWLLRYGEQSLPSLAAALAVFHTTANYFFGWPISPAAPEGSWSLVVEEHFYLLAPIAIVAAASLGGLRAVTVFAALAVASGPVVRMLMTASFAPDDGNWHFASFVQFHSRYDEIAAGVLAACLVSQASVPSAWLRGMAWVAVMLLAAFVLFLVSAGFLYSPQTITRETIWVPTTLAIAFTCAVLALHEVPIKSRLVMALARLSYPLYLFHLVVRVASIAHQDDWPIFSVPQSLFGFYGSQVLLVLYSIALAYAVSLLIEFPFLRLYKPDLGKPSKLNSLAQTAPQS